MRTSLVVALLISSALACSTGGGSERGSAGPQSGSSGSTSRGGSAGQSTTGSPGAGAPAMMGADTTSVGGVPSGGAQQSTGGGGASSTSAGGPSAARGGTTNSGGAPGGTSGTGGGSGAAGASGVVAGGGMAGASGAPSGGSGGAATGTCTRDSLQAATKSLADALAAKDATKMALDARAKYVENLAASDFTEGIWTDTHVIAFQRDFLDVEECQTFSEIIITQGTPYVLGVRLTLTEGKVSDVTALVSDNDDWQFDAANYEKVSAAEDWSVIPEDQRDSRDVLIAAGNAYFDLFNDKSVMVPWNSPCTRLEGGKLTTGNTCDVGVPDGITFADKHWVVDRDLGTAIGMVRFGGASGIPDSHMFRCLKGKIRYVHTISICNGGC